MSPLDADVQPELAKPDAEQPPNDAVSSDARTLDASIDVSGAGSDGSNGVDARPVVSSGPGCNNLITRTTAVPGILREVPPLVGGLIADGIYEIVMTYYDAIAPEPRGGGLEVTQNAFKWLRTTIRSDSDFEERARGTFTTAGNVITFTSTCGGFHRSYQYTAKSDELLLYDVGLLIRLQRR